METRVEIRLTEKVTSSIKKEIVSLSKCNTPTPKVIRVEKDKIDNHLVIVRFNSYPGKQRDIVGPIMKSYTLYLESIDDISVAFKTKRNDLIYELDLLEKKDVEKVVKEYFKYIDENDWESLISILSDKIEIGKYNKDSFRRHHSLKKVVSIKYVNQLKKVRETVKCKHRITKNSIIKDSGKINCRIEYVKKSLLENQETIFNETIILGLSIDEEKLKIYQIISA